MADEYFEFKAQFDSTVAAAKALQEELLRDAEEAQLAGRDIEAARLRMRAAATTGPQAAQVEGTNAALKGQQAALEAVNQEALFNLDVLKEQNQQYVEQAAMVERLKGGQLELAGLGRSAGAAPMVTPLGMPATAARDAQLNAERQLATQIAEENALLLEQEKIDQAILTRRQEAYATGRAAGVSGQVLSAGDRKTLAARPAGVPPDAWTTAEAGQTAYMARLGEFRGISASATAETDRLSSSVVRLGLADAEASQQMRAHGALTTEWLGALARGETTVSELGYQVGATIGKFAGWAVAAAATYAALGAIYEVGKGAVDAASGVQQLTRTIDGLDRGKASIALQNLSADVNVPIKEAADAVFAFSRTFHNLDDATTAARLALSAYKLDGVAVTDSVKAMTVVHQQFGLSANQLVGVYDMLAQGQQKFNARISDAIPLIQRSASAVKNAGGDFNSYLQLSTVALRTTQLGGSQLGTIFQRSAANFLSPTTSKGRSDLAVLQGLGINTQVGWTKLVEEMIARSGSLSNADRGRMVAAFAGPQLGGRAAGLFAPTTEALLRQVQREENPQASRGVLQTELNKELGTASQEFKRFKVELQDFGAALAGSGIVTVFTSMLGAILSVLDAGRKLIDAFDGLSGPVKAVVEALVALRLASLLVSRTRLGGSIPLISSLPGFRPSEGTVARQQIQLGTRNAINAFDGQIASNSAKSLSIATEMQTIKAQQTALGKQTFASEAEEKAAADESVKLQADLVRLQAEQTRLQKELAAQYTAQGALVKTNVAASTVNRSKRLSDPEAKSIANEMGLSEQVAAQTARNAGLSAYVAQQAGIAKTKLVGKVKDEAGAIGFFGKATQEQAVAVEEAGVATEATEVEMLTAGGAMRATAASVQGFVAAIDPMLAALVLLPLAWAAISDAANSAKAATKKATDSLNTPIHNLQDVRSVAQGLRDASQRQAQSHIHGIGAPVQGLEAFAGGVLNNRTLMNAAGDPLGAATSAGQAQQITAIGDLYKRSSDLFTKDADALVTTGKGRQKVYDISQEMKQRMGSVLQSSGLPQKDINRIYGAFTDALQVDYDAAVALAAGRAKGKNLIDLLDRETTKDLSKSVQGYSDRADIYGLKGMDWTRLGDTYLLLAARYRNSNDQTGLQLVKQAQQALVTAVNKNVTDLQLAAESQTTQSGYMGDLNAAVGTIQAMKGRVQQWETAMEQHFKNYPKIIQAVKAAAAQIDAQLNDKLKSAIDQQLAAIKTEGDLLASQITGISPEADIARAQVVLTNLQQQLAKARSEGANWLVLAGLLTQINNQAQAVIKQKIANGDAIAQAQEALSIASITGLSPQDDIARAQQAVTNAQNNLSRDSAEGKGQAQILTDQAAVFDSERALNQAIQSHNAQLDQDLASFIESEAALAESQTLDPVKQANEELAAAIKVLGTIKPADFKTPQEYQTAVNNQQAKINKDKQAKYNAIATQREQTLQFEFDTLQIGDQQYINGLEKILKAGHLSQQEIQNLRKQIFDLKQGMGKQLDLNVGNIKLPSVYEVRRAIGLGKRGVIPDSGTQINHNATVTVYVNKAADAQVVGQVLDAHLGTSVQPALRAKGLV